MLREVKDLRPRPDEPPRRWFTDEYFDLFVWFGPDGKVCRFELAYGKPSDEHAVAWEGGSGLTHSRVDDGESSPLSNRTPVIVPDGVFPAADVAERFRQASGGLEAGLAGFVLERLRAGGD
jgi:hypothetical protein